MLRGQLPNGVSLVHQGDPLGVPDFLHLRVHLFCCGLTLHREFCGNFVSKFIMIIYKPNVINAKSQPSPGGSFLLTAITAAPDAENAPFHSAGLFTQ